MHAPTGRNKNDRLHALTMTWTARVYNETPESYPEFPGPCQPSVRQPVHLVYLSQLHICRPRKFGHIGPEILQRRAKR